MDLKKHQHLDNDKIYLYVKDPLESKYQLLINGYEKVGIENFKNSHSTKKAFLKKKGIHKLLMMFMKI